MIQRSDFLIIYLDNLLMRDRQDRFINYLNTTELNKMVEGPVDKLAQLSLATWSDRLPNRNFTTLFFELDPAAGLELDRVCSLEPAYAELFKEKSAPEVLQAVWKRLFQGALQEDYDRFHISSADDLVQAWLEQLWAQSILQLSTFLSCREVLQIFDNTELLHDFFNTFIQQFPTAWLEEDRASWTRVQQRPEKMVELFKHDDYVFEQFSRSSPDTTTPLTWNFFKPIMTIGHNLILSEQYVQRGYLLREKNTGMWVEYWDNLIHPLLQVAVVQEISTSEKIREILLSLKTQADTLKCGPSELALLLLDRFFHLLKNNWQMLAQYKPGALPSIGRNLGERDEFIQRGVREVQAWLEDKEQLGAEIIKLVSEVAGPVCIAEWLFDQRPASGGHPDFANHYNMELAFIRSLLEPVLKATSTEDHVAALEKKFSFSYLRFIVDLVEEQQSGDGYKKKLLDALTQHLAGQKRIWLGNFDKETEEGLNVTAKVLDLQPDPIKEYDVLLDRYRTAFEGWNVKTYDFYESATRESFLLAATIPFWEGNIKEAYSPEYLSFYKRVLDQILCQKRFAVSINFYTPVITRLGHTAKILGLGDLYDGAVIASVDSLAEVLEIISERPGELSPGNKDLLSARVTAEWRFERLKMRGVDVVNKVARLDAVIDRLQV